MTYNLLQNGERKYLNRDERERFLRTSREFTNEIKSLCYTLAYTGSRLSESLELTCDRIDFDEKTIVFETLKKRRKGMYRAVPVPDLLIDMLDHVHDIRNREAIRKNKRGKRTLIWTFSRTTAWRRIIEVMEQANLSGVKATPKGLRHAFGINAVQSGVQLHMLSKWMGHTSLNMTTIYATATGEAEREVASRMWK